MDRAAGHYSQCLLSADASYARHGNATKLENRQTRCETRFDRRTSRAIHRHGEDECPSSDLVAAMEDRTVTYAQGAATEASGTASPSFLFVQNGTGGTLSDTTLTLTGVSSKTGYFSDRPYRLAGQVPTEEFITAWGEAGSSLTEDPPNADFTCTVDGNVTNYVVELTLPGMAGEDLSYSVNAVGDTVLPETAITCEADSLLLIDSLCVGPYADCMTSCAEGEETIQSILACDRACGVMCYECYGPGDPAELCTVLNTP